MIGIYVISDVILTIKNICKLHKKYEYCNIVWGGIQKCTKLDFDIKTIASIGIDIKQVFEFYQITTFFTFVKSQTFLNLTKCTNW